MSFIRDMTSSAQSRLHPQAPAGSSDLEEIFAQLEAGYSQSVADDPPLLYSRDSPNPDQYGPGVPLPVPRTMTSSQAIKGLYAMTEGEIASLQRRLLNGGFYSGDIQDDDLTGVLDDDTIAAYKRAVDRAAGYLDANQNKSLDEVIDGGRRPASAGAGQKRAPKPCSLGSNVTKKAAVRRR